MRQMTSIPLSALLKNVPHLECVGSSTHDVTEFLPLSSSKHHTSSITWCADGNVAQLSALPHGTVLCGVGAREVKVASTLTLVIVENPRRAFQLAAQLFSKAAKPDPRVSALASIHPTAQIGRNVSIGDFAVISENCSIGDNTTINAHTVIHAHTQIGSHVVIGANNTIGGVGFGYEPNEKGDLEAIPHLGNVVIEDCVEIGNNTAIDRAALGSTRICRNAKIDNLVHIAHGVEIGENSLIIAHAIIGGSTKIGKNCWIAPNASIMQGITIGDEVTVGLAAVVLKDVARGDTVVGNPARAIRNKFAS